MKKRLLALAAVLVVVSSSGSAQTPAQQDARAVTASNVSVGSALHQQVREELLLQRAAWQALEKSEHPPLPFYQNLDMQPHRTRMDYAFCASGGPERGGTLKIQYRRLVDQHTFIRSESAVSGPCPFWIPQRVPGRYGRTHEYKGHNPTPAQLHPFSRALVAALEVAAQAESTEIWPISQLVRVLTENGHAERATEALAACRVDESWCTMLRLHAAHEAGAHRTADSLAQLLLRYSPADVRRRLLDPSDLFWADDMARYDSLSASSRDSAIATMWWLAKPFFGDSVHARQSEHLSRLVRNTLVQQLDIDAHYHTDPANGGDAVQVMRQKFGWSTHQAWVGEAEDKRVGKFTFITPGPPYSAAEYSWPQVAVVPRLDAVLAPYLIKDDDFRIGPPDSLPYWRWWPAEFFRHPDGHIVPFRREQRVFLRRDEAMRVLIATDLRSDEKPSELDSLDGMSARGELWYGSGPDSTVRLHAASALVGERLNLFGDVRSPGVMSAEYRVNANGLAGGRARFGISDLHTLGNMPASSCALSVPMLVDPSALEPDAGVAIEIALLGSLTLDNPSQLGLAWESYGVEPGDTTTVAVHIRRLVDIGRMQRVGMAFGIAEDPSVEVGMRWTEPEPGRSREALETSVPVLQRHITLGVASLKAGEYTLQIEMANAKCGTLQSEQTITISR